MLLLLNYFIIPIIIGFLFSKSNGLIVGELKPPSYCEIQDDFYYGDDKQYYYDDNDIDYYSTYVVNDDGYSGLDCTLEYAFNTDGMVFCELGYFGKVFEFTDTIAVVASREIGEIEMLVLYIYEPLLDSEDWEYKGTIRIMTQYMPSSIRISKDTIAVGLPQCSKVLIFERNDEEIWQITHIFAPSNDPNAKPEMENKNPYEEEYSPDDCFHYDGKYVPSNFGKRVELSNDYLIVSYAKKSQVYIYNRGSSSWKLMQKITNSIDNHFDFGNFIGFSNDTLIVSSVICFISYEQDWTGLKSHISFYKFKKKSGEGTPYPTSSPNTPPVSFPYHKHAWVKTNSFELENSDFIHEIAMNGANIILSFRNFRGAAYGIYILENNDLVKKMNLVDQSEEDDLMKGITDLKLYGNNLAVSLDRFDYSQEQVPIKRGIIVYDIQTRKPFKYLSRKSSVFSLFGESLAVKLIHLTAIHIYKNVSRPITNVETLPNHSLCSGGFETVIIRSNQTLLDLSDFINYNSNDKAKVDFTPINTLATKHNHLGHSTCYMIDAGKDRILEVKTSLDPTNDLQGMRAINLFHVENSTNEALLNAELLIYDSKSSVFYSRNRYLLMQIIGKPTVDGNIIASKTVKTIEGWTCPLQLFEDGDYCDCGCGILDPDCLLYNSSQVRCYVTSENFQRESPHHCNITSNQCVNDDDTINCKSELFRDQQENGCGECLQGYKSYNSKFDLANTRCFATSPLQIQYTKMSSTRPGHESYELPMWGDMDGDGNVDLMVLQQHGDNTISLDLFHNDGNLYFQKQNGNSGVSFTTNSHLSPHQEFFYVGLIDFDKDGDLDLVCGVLDSDAVFDSVTLLLWKNEGSRIWPIFDTQNIEIIYQPVVPFEHFRVGDFDFDGDVDFLFPDGRYIENVGSTKSPQYIERDFHALITLTETHQSELYECFDRGEIAVGDFNNDQNLDFICVAGREITLYTSNHVKKFPPISFRDQPMPPYTLDQVVAIDIDGDGDLDLVSVDSGYEDSERYKLWLENIGDKTQPQFLFMQLFIDFDSSPFDLGEFHPSHFIDIDGDSYIDVLNLCNGEEYLHNIGNEAFPIYFQTRDERIINPLGVICDFVNFVSLATFTDIDVDGDYDVFITTRNDLMHEFTFFRNVGNKTHMLLQVEDPEFLRDVLQPLHGIMGNYMLTFEDLNGDGSVDVVKNNSLFVRENDTFMLWTENLFDVNGAVYSVTFYDIDNDEDVDAFVNTQSGLELFMNFGDRLEPNFKKTELELFQDLRFENLLAISFPPIYGENEKIAFVYESRNRVAFYKQTQVNDFLKFTEIPIDTIHTFQSASFETLGLLVGDFDGDAINDIVRYGVGSFDSAKNFLDHPLFTEKFIKFPFMGFRLQLHPRDVNGDGRLDLIDFCNGRLWINGGPKLFTTFYLSDRIIDEFCDLSYDRSGVENDDSYSSEPSFERYRKFWITLVDLNGDGEEDVFITPWLFFENQGNFTFLKKNIVGLGKPFETDTALGLCRFVDVDNDDDFDAFCVNGGSILLYKNQGDQFNGLFALADSGENPLSYIQVSQNQVTDFIIEDWDRDGDLDIFLVDSGEIRYFKNTFVECASRCSNRGTCADEPELSSPIFSLTKSFHGLSGPKHQAIGMCTCESNAGGPACEQCEASKYGSMCDKTCPERSKTNFELGDYAFPDGPSLEDCICEGYFERSSNGSDWECTCPPGFGYNNITQVCEICNVGLYKSTFSLDGCVSCETKLGVYGTTKRQGANAKSECECKTSFVIDPETEKCTCPPGYEYESTSDSCTSCPVGAYKETYSFDPCVSCDTIFGANKATTDREGSTSVQSCRCLDSFEAYEGACVCGPGFTLSAQTNECIPCEIGTFKQNFSLDPCNSCENELGGSATTLFQGAQSIYNCSCEVTFEFVNETCVCEPNRFYNDGICERCPQDRPLTQGSGKLSIDDCVAAPGTFIKFGTEEIESCESMFGNDVVNCSFVGLTTESLAILPGHWRIQNTSLDIRPCKRKIQCDGTSDDHPYCSKYHQGILCTQCLAGFAIAWTGSCEECTDDRIEHETTMTVILSILLFFIILIPGLRVMYLLYRKNSNRKRCWHKLKPPPYILECGGTKLRIFIGFFQVYFQFVVAFNIFLTESRGIWILDLFSNLDLTAALGIVNVNCVFNTSYYTRLFVYTLIPLVALGFMLLLLVAHSRCQRFSTNLSLAVGSGTYIAIQLMLVIYPGVCASILKVFLFDPILHSPEDQYPYFALQEDYGINYDSTESLSMRIYAGFMVLIYPVGIPLLFTKAVQMSYYKTTENTSLNKTAIVGACKVLRKPYQNRFRYFECFELLRKLLATSFMLIIKQLSDGGAQIYFIVLSAFAAMIQMYYKPFKSYYDQLSSLLSLILLFGLGMISIVPDHFNNVDPFLVGDLVISIAIIAWIGIAILFLLEIFLNNKEEQGKKSQEKFKPEEDSFPKLVEESNPKESNEYIESRIVDTSIISNDEHEIIDESQPTNEQNKQQILSI